MTTQPYILDKELYQKNLTFWQGTDPLIAARLLDVKNNLLGRLIRPEGSETEFGRPVDLEVNGHRYFNTDVWQQTLDRVDSEKYSRNVVSFPSMRISLDDPEFDPIYETTILSKFRQILESNSDDYAGFDQPLAIPAQYVLFGLGLGCPLEYIVMNTDAKIILMVEPSIEMLHHSLFVVDYQSLQEKLVERNGRFLIKIHDLNETCVDKVCDFLRYNGFSYVASAKFLINDTIIVNNEFVANLVKKSLIILGTKGFFNDQIKMIRNYTTNLYRKKVSLLDSSEIYIPKLPCFIIGNGPSLEQSYDVIRKYRDKVVIISCGTALSSLLAADIRPDIHVELENIPEVPIILRRLRDKYGFEGIHFVHTSSFNPSESNLFSKTMQFHRSGIFNFLHNSQHFASLSHAEPTVTNLGIALAARFGFSEVYFFGVDMGTIDETKFHAANNIYDDEEGLKKLGWKKNIGNPKLLPVNFPANFGGVGQTSGVMLFSKPRIETVIEAFKSLLRIKFYNCSDGLLIQGTIPKLPQSVKIDVADDAKANFLHVFSRAHQSPDDINEPIEHLEAQLNPKYICESFNKIRRVIDENAPKVLSDTIHAFYDLFNALEVLFETDPDTFNSPSMRYHTLVISGSVYLWTQKYLVFDAHTPRHLRAELGEIFIEAFRAAIDEMERIILEVAEEFTDVLEERRQSA